MRKAFFAALVAVSLLAASAKAQCCGGCGCPPIGVNLGFSFNGCNSCGCPTFGFNCGCTGFGSYGSASGPGMLGPWYLYWPMEAHFQSPAPTGYPYWPSPLALPPGGGLGGPAPANFMPASLQPSVYGAPTPAYWSR